MRLQREMQVGLCSPTASDPNVLSRPLRHNADCTATSQTRRRPAFTCSTTKTWSSTKVQACATFLYVVLRCVIATVAEWQHTSGFLGRRQEIWGDASQVRHVMVAPAACAVRRATATAALSSQKLLVAWFACLHARATYQICHDWC